VQQRVVDGRHGCHLENMTSYHNLTLSINKYLLEEQSSHISSRAFLKRSPQQEQQQQQEQDE